MGKFIIGRATNETTNESINSFDMNFDWWNTSHNQSEDLGDLLYGRDGIYFPDTEEYYSDVDKVFYDESTDTYNIEIADTHYIDRKSHYGTYCNELEEFTEF